MFTTFMVIGCVIMIYSLYKKDLHGQNLALYTLLMALLVQTE